MTDSVKNETVPLTADTQTEATITSTVSSTPKKLEVVPNWKSVLLTYSFWTMVVSVLLSFVEQILPFFGLLEPTMSVATYGITVFCLNLSAVIFRLIKQKSLWKIPTQSDSSTL